ncbi:MAG: DUF4097 domain-containing protein [Firmicutes bacterium]|nr:DUF4097 domain-containing protein [Bacillota bacterium]
MNEERFLILKMVEEGKITAQEAATLIRALEEAPVYYDTWEEEPESGGEQEEARGHWSTAEGFKEMIEKAGDSEFSRRLEQEATRFAKNVEGAAEKLSKVIEERIQRDVRPALANLPNFIANIPVVGEWMGHFSTITEEKEGWFTEEEARLEVVSKNGSISLEGWEKEHFKLLLHKKVRGADDQSIRERADEIAEIHEDGRSLRILSHAGPNEVLHVKLWVPRGRRYHISFGTSNGNISVENLDAAAGGISTTNGKVQLTNLLGNRITARASNGAVECVHMVMQELILANANGKIVADDIFAPRLEARSSNGSITVCPRGGVGQAQSLDLHTSNGGISVQLPADLQSACWLDASSSLGTIKSSLEGLQYFIKEHSLGYNRVQAETQGYAEQEGKISIYARTSNGAISVE